MTVRIRKFDLRKDLNAVLQFQYETYERNFPGLRVDRAFLADYGRQLRTAVRSRSEQLWVLEVGGRVQGFVWGTLITSMVDEFVGYIKNVYVAPEIRSQGYARRLLETAEDWPRSEGAPKAALDASLCNPEAMALYEKAGYRGARVRMEKLLDNPEGRPEDNE